MKSNYEKAVSQTKERHALQRKLSEGKLNVKKLNEDLKRVEAVVTALAKEKVYSPEMLGQGRLRGGHREHRQNRNDALERVRRLGNLTEEQNGQWEFFKTEWDAAQALSLIHI